MKRYKNKEIRELYSLKFAFAVTGMIFTILSTLLIVYGLIATVRVMNDRHPYEEFLKRDGNHAGHIATFEVVEKPIKVGNAYRANYYLVTDGNRYIISEMKEWIYEEVRDEVELCGKSDLEGMTFYISDKDERKEIAENVSRELGKKVTEENLDDVVGDVRIKYTPFNYISVFWTGYLVNIILGGLFLIVGGAMWIGFSAELRASRRFISLSNVTAEDVDREASEPDAVCYSRIQVCLTRTMLVGMRADISSGYYDQVAFKFEEIRRAFGVTEVTNLGGTRKRKFKIYVEAADGQQYVLSDIEPTYAADEVMAERVSLFEKLKGIAPHILMEPADARYEVYRYPFYVGDSDSSEGMAEGTEAYEMVSDYLDELVWEFEQDNIAQSYQNPEAIFSMKIAFTQAGFAEVTVGYFAKFENEIKANMNEFLREQLMEGLGEYVSEDYMIRFCEK